MTGVQTCALPIFTVTNGKASSLSGSGSSYTFTVTPTTDGPVTVQIPANKAQDSAGNGNSASDPLSVTYDHTAPNTTITSNPTNPSNSDSAVFNFISNETPSTFECQIDSKEWVPCTSPTSYSSLPDGSHTFSVIAKDAAGNTDTTPPSYTWIITTDKPTVTLTTAATSPTNAAFTVTANFTKSVTGLEEGEITVTNGKASSLSGSGSSYTFKIGRAHV